jgi:hypothetical protein
MSNAETNIIPDFLKNDADSSRVVVRRERPEMWWVSRHIDQHRGIGVRSPTLIPERRRAMRPCQPWAAASTIAVS